MYFDLNYVIEQVGKEKGIPKEILIETLEEAVLSASKKKFGNNLELEARYNEELGEIEIFRFKTVTDDVQDPDVEILLEDAKAVDPECIQGDSIGIKMDASQLGRIAAQTAKQVIMQKVRNAESDVIYNEYKDRKGTIVTGIVQRVEKNHYVVNLGKTEAVLPFKETIPNDSFKRRDRVKAYVLDVDKDQKGCTILLSRTHPNFLVRLFEVEVPEIQEGIIKVIGAAREPGERAKISVYSGDASIDPIGACVGVKGSRVQAVVQELRGEKIDIIPWSKDPAKFACNALAPARVSKVYINEEDTSMEIVVNDDQLSLAIGKKGQNVRLASRLTGWKIDIKSEAEVEKTSRKVIDDLTQNLKINEILARVLFDEYLRDARDIARLTPEELSKVTSISVEDCRAIIENAKLWSEALEKQAAEAAALASEAQAQSEAQAENELQAQTQATTTEQNGEAQAQADKPGAAGTTAAAITTADSTTTVSTAGTSSPSSPRIEQAPTEG